MRTSILSALAAAITTIVTTTTTLTLTSFSAAATASPVPAVAEKDAPACRGKMPYVALTLIAEKVNDFRLLGYPLWDPERCLESKTGQAVEADGYFQPKKIRAFGFNIQSPLRTEDMLEYKDNDNVPRLLAFVNSHLGLGPDGAGAVGTAAQILGTKLLVCAVRVKVTGSGRHIFIGGEDGSNDVQFPDPVEVESYHCCIDYDKNKCGLS